MRFEISHGKNQVNIFGRTVLTARKAREISERTLGANFGANFGNFVSKFVTFSETSFSRRAVLITCQKNPCDSLARIGWVWLKVA